MIEIIKEKNPSALRFTLMAESGTILLRSTLFHDRPALKRVLENLGALQEKRNSFERKTNHDGQFLFNLKNADGDVIGTSQAYRSEAGMENGIKNLKKRIVELHRSNQLQIP